jgi:hypothetical protein
VSRHYEIMRVMQKKILDSRELWHSMESIFFVIGAIRDRVDDLASMLTILSLKFGTLTLPIRVDIFSQQKHDPERHFQTFAYGIVRYVFFIRSVLPSEVFGL